MKLIEVNSASTIKREQDWIIEQADRELDICVWVSVWMQLSLGQRAGSGLALMGVCSLVFDEGFPVSGTNIRFLGNPTMETPLSQASTT